MSSTPYYRISFVYFAYFCVVGALTPYWSLYLDYLKFDPAAIGIIVAIPMFTKVIAPNIWGWLADTSGRRLLVARLGAAGSFLCFAGMLGNENTLIFILLIAAYSFFWNAIHAQFEVVTLGYLGDKPERYSHVRLWGTVGFIVVVIGLGKAFDSISVSYLPVIILSFLGLIFLSTLTLPKLKNTSNKKALGTFLVLIKEKPIYLFLVVLFLIQFSLGIYHAFFSLYMEQHGYSRTAIGLFWAVGASAEVLLFIFVPKLIRQFTLFKLIVVTIAFTMLRWMLTCFLANNLPIMVFAQCIHAFTFGMTHVVAIEFVRQKFGEQNQGQGQAFYNAVGFGAANALGSVVGGLFFEWNPQSTFVVAFIIVSFAALMLIWHRNRFLI